MKEREGEENTESRNKKKNSVASVVEKTGVNVYQKIKVAYLYQSLY